MVMTMFTRSLYGPALAAIAFATAAHGQTSVVVAKPTASAQVAPSYGNIDPFYGNISAFWKDINPFYGNIDPFWKDINPFYGNIDPFYGNIDPFWGNIDPFYGNIDPFYGNIDPFAGTTPTYDKVGDFWRMMGPVWSEANTQWGAVGSYSQDATKYRELQKTLNALVDRSQATWGTAVTARTGKSFRAGFADAMFAKHGVNLDNIATFEGLTAAQRARFFLDWYDGLMDYSGRDHLDHWMGTVNWSPALTKTQGGGTGSIIGLLDSKVVNDPDLANNIIYSGGYDNPLNGHGTAVASLMVAAHDGRGLMGIAPNATVATFNPFDATGTASWADVTAGVLALSARGASVINMSLGVPGSALHNDWNLVFANSAVAAATQNTVFVIAAGNEGKVQLTNNTWNWATDPNLIVVGSVDPSGQISRFSNTPGTACLLNAGGCSEANRLWNRFIVAPGEAILVSDGNGGHVRRSGTSFAAPLVTGAIALLHDRWPWLAKHPDETVDIILRSAKDLGSPGPDQVYGRGLLDVKASQSPLNFNNLFFYEFKNGAIYPRTATSIRANGIKANWEADGVFFAMFEGIGNTMRDFVVPLSSRLVGQKLSAGSYSEYFQSYLTTRFVDWIKTGRLAGTPATATFSDVETASMASIGDLDLSFSASPSFAYAGHPTVNRAPHSMVRFADRTRGLAVTAGFGQGALALGGGRGFGLTSDHHSADGGVNPVLGFASGGAFAAVDLKLAPRWTLSGGLTSNRLVHSRLPGLGEDDRIALIDLDPYRAQAFTLAVSHDVGSALNISASYTRLAEQAAVLGVQSIEAGDLAGGSVSDAATLAASASLGKGIQLSLSATAANTHTGDSRQAFTTGAGGVLSSAFAVAAAKRGILGQRDQLRLSLAQPLHIERGPMEFTSVEVVDRSTGVIGPVTQRFDIGGQERRYIGEFLYATPLPEDAGELSLFGRAQLSPGTSAKVDDYVVGGRFRVSF